MRKLYLGIDLPADLQALHYPVIRTVPLEIAPHLWDNFPNFTHVIFTSKNGVKIFLQSGRSLHQKQLLAIGQKTAAQLLQVGLRPLGIAETETQEGMIELLRTLDLKGAYILYPRSALARKPLENFLIEQQIRYQVWDLYTTVFQKPLPVPDLNLIDEIIFTSPSTVRAFIAAFGQIPPDKKLTCIGPVTEAELLEHLEFEKAQKSAS